MNNNELFQNFVYHVATTANALKSGDVEQEELMQASSEKDGEKKTIDALGDVVTAIRFVIKCLFEGLFAVSFIYLLC